MIQQLVSVNLPVDEEMRVQKMRIMPDPVSYTHLTLPTNNRV